jgi:hypothetical protein
VGIESASTVTTPEPDVRVPTPRRLGWSFAVGWLVLVAGVEFALSWLLPSIGESLTGPALAVAGAGFGLGWVGYLVALYLTGRDGFVVSTWARRAVGTGQFVLPFLSLAWNLPDDSRVLMPVGWVMGGVAVVLVALALVFDRREKPDPWLPVTLWILCFAAVVVASSYMWAVPNGLSLKFATTDETHLARVAASVKANRAPVGCVSAYLATFDPRSLVCSELSSNVLSISLEGSAWGYLDAPQMTYATAPWGSCVVHLIGPWWEEGPGGGGAPCAGGFEYTPGG